MMISCNGQQEKKNINSKKNSGTSEKMMSKKLDLTNFKFEAKITDVLKTVDLSLNDNSLNEYNMSGDYEEFKFSSPKISLFGNDFDFPKNELSFFYTKKDELLWCYELNIYNNDEALQIIRSFELKYGAKPAFSKITLSTKEHPIFLDENGEFEKDKMEQRILVWEDFTNNTTFFLIYNVNYDKKPIEAGLQIIAIDKTSKKYTEWVSYRSLDMYYKK